MTSNSKQRAAEQAVIDAAFVWFAEPATKPMSPGELALAGALRELRELRLELPDQARSSRGHPVTSDQAAAWMRGPRAKSAAARIVREVWDWPITGRTVDELIASLGMPHQTCSPRVNELRNDGWLVDSGQKRATRSGNEAIVWVLSARA